MFTTGWAAPRRRSVCRTADVLALKSLLGRFQLLVAFAAVLSLYFTGTFISYLSLLRDYDIRPVVLHPTKRADFSRHGYRAAHFEDAFARFLPHEPNIRTLKRGRDGM